MAVSRDATQSVPITNVVQILPYDINRTAILLSNLGANNIFYSSSPAVQVGFGAVLEPAVGGAWSSRAFSGEEWRGFIQGPIFAISQTTANILGIIESLK